ncbi:MAG: UDP-N-acetylmuramoyl-tripeptide--D-alanyl-D-alanine ligase [Patescibacteria group bacterium]|nr:UDP-N-acetylmuramoyl-tripeptide--D-alanyl-D-alanine ligase [Patescibacteria group bacterium]
MIKHLLKNIIVWILELEARLVLKKYKPKIIAVTGNVGKTSMKDAIYVVLCKAYYVRKSEKSFNSELGVPLTILGCESGWNSPRLWMSNIMEGLALIFLKNHYPKWLILEVGADRPGDIARIAKWLSPDMVVVTHIGEVPVHVEFFKSVKEVVAEKTHLVHALKEGGLLFLNVDDEQVLSMKEYSRGKVFTFGTGEKATMRATNEQILYDKDGKPTGVTFKINYGENSVPVRLQGTAGFSYAYAVLAALLISVSEGFNLLSAVEWIQEYQTPPGRLKIIEGINHTTILDDSYNSSPAALHAALSALAAIETKGRKIAVLGDMMELGKHSTDEHKKAGARVADVCDMLVVVGLRAKTIAEEAHAKKMGKRNILSFDDAREAGTALKDIVSEGDIILVKGSQSMRMERAVEELMAHPEHKRQLLVRQEMEWLER